ncbi:MAG: hypothetical protein GWN84_15020 [Gammaproteobacteria bacterium]|nr:hypothetical protein [Gammaproteobacteria bacterium]NIR84109.1 hypothetical protein [Gammaproteobacteria bacterium]NIR89407.1 hypothetical protein [Gammaproteobacteria bacterium]NIU07128.1 hypothetical protein [Gammaproteobacteria bacterium]NIV74632.1 hypothetical protein [Gammaproteobacteria bacterium]
MSARKTALLNLRIDPTIKEALREAARREHRSIANMVEVLTRRHCEDAGIPLVDPAADPPQDAPEESENEEPLRAPARRKHVVTASG